MTGARLDIGIVGCGFAGGAAGTLLARAGHRVTVYERAPEPHAVGAGILLQPTGLAVLAELGLLEAVLARGAPVKALRARTTSGHRLFELEYARLAPGWCGLGLHRGALFDVLRAALLEGGAELRAGTEVEALDSGGARPRLSGKGGAPVGEHDVVLVADGARSKLRAASPGRVQARVYPWGALWFVAEDPLRIFPDTLAQVCEGTATMLGFLPTGLGPGRGAVPLVSVFWSIELDRVDAWRAAGLAAWKKTLLRLEPRAEPLLSAVTDERQVLVASYLDVVMARVAHGRVAYLGDAAHATSPQLGQGTNLALLDASVLARALASDVEPTRALAQYARERAAHTRFYGRASRWLTPFFQSDRRWLGALRDRSFPWLSRRPWIERQMLATLSGLKQGVFTRNLPLAAGPRALPASR